MDVSMIVCELAFDGIVSLGKCSRSTVYRWTKSVNGYLEFNRYDWRVRANYKDCCIEIA